MVEDGPATARGMKTESASGKEGANGSGGGAAATGGATNDRAKRQVCVFLTCLWLVYSIVVVAACCGFSNGSHIPCFFISFRGENSLAAQLFSDCTCDKLWLLCYDIDI
jgi:hypothetical protein